MGKSFKIWTYNIGESRLGEKHRKKGKKEERKKERKKGKKRQ
jgi:hypothetical protein